jgi:hypothetical protein
MKNLLNTLSLELQKELSDFGVSLIFIEYGELNVRSEYPMDYSFKEAIAEELNIDLNA